MRSTVLSVTGGEGGTLRQLSAWLSAIAPIVSIAFSAIDASYRNSEVSKIAIATIVATAYSY